MHVRYAVTVLAMALVFWGAGHVAPPVAAQDPQLVRLVEEINRLRRDIADLQRQAYQRGTQFAAAAPGTAVVGESAGRSARFEVRLGELEDEMRTLTGEVESVAHEIRGLSSRIDKLVGDIDMRLRPIERAQATTAAAVAMPAAVAGTAPEEAVPLTAPAPSVPAPPGDADSLSALLFPPIPAAAEPQVPAAPVVPEAPETQAVDEALPPGSPEQQYAYAFALLRKADYAEAERALRAFIEAHPDSELTGNAYYWLAETFYVRNDLEQAAVYFARGYQDFGDSIKASDNLLKLAMSLARLGRTDDACLTFQELGERFPDVSAQIKERAEAEGRRAGCT